MQGNRPERVAEQIRQEISLLLGREVHDPGIGLVTLTRVKVSPDLQLARIYYTLIGDDKARQDTAKALERASPFLRRQLGSRMRLRRVPEIQFHFDESVEHQDRIERILLDLEAERAARGPVGDSTDPAGPSDPADPADAAVPPDPDDEAPQ